MNTPTTRSGFSLIEVNMAIFVMAIGVLSLVVLYPLGLRESTQGAADLKQSMFADYVLNQAVAWLSETNRTWSEWEDVPRLKGATVDLGDSVPKALDDILKDSVRAAYSDMEKDKHYRIACCRVPGASDKVMGIMVQSTDMVKTVKDFTQVTNNPIYYAEVLFQGDPTR